MSNSNDSICQLFQRHIDAFIDNDLEPAREEELKSHLQQCPSCSVELAYAEQLHRAVVDLPILDCSHQTLEPIDRLFAASKHSPSSKARSLVGVIGGYLISLPGAVRYGVPSVAVVLLAAGLGNNLWNQPTGGEQAHQGNEFNSSAPQYSQADLIKALEDLEVAMGYLRQISQRTNAMIEDRFLIRQLEESINASFRNEESELSDRDKVNGPF